MTASARTALPPIVTSNWLAEHLDEVVVIDTRRADEFRDGHVPGAISFPLGALLVEDTRRNALMNLARIAQAALARRGVHADDQVVLIDDNDGSASLGSFVCELAGMRAVTMVHGGIRAWLHGGGATQIAPTTREPVANFGGQASLASLASIEDVDDALGTSARIVDTRSQLEHEGIVGTPCCASRGSIDGSVHLEWTALLSATGDLHDPERIRREAHHVGLEEGDDIIVYCHTGHRAAIAALALRAAGFTRVRNYIGSWHEWSHRSAQVAAEDALPPIVAIAPVQEHAAIV